MSNPNANHYQKNWSKKGLKMGHSLWNDHSFFCLVLNSGINGALINGNGAIYLKENVKATKEMLDDVWCYDLWLT